MAPSLTNQPPFWFWRTRCFSSTAEYKNKRRLQWHSENECTSIIFLWSRIHFSSCLQPNCAMIDILAPRLSSLCFTVMLFELITHEATMSWLILSHQSECKAVAAAAMQSHEEISGTLSNGERKCTWNFFLDFFRLNYFLTLYLHPQTESWDNTFILPMQTALESCVSKGKVR